MSSYEDRLAQESSRFDAEINVHDLPSIFHYWSNKYLRPMLNALGYDGVVDFFAKEAAKSIEGHGQARIVGIGSGDCATEIDVASRLRDMGVLDIQMLCLDISAEALDRARTTAEAKGFTQFQFMKHDFNLGLPQGEWNIAIANQSLHHVMALERLFDSVKEKLQPGGVFLISDIIGRNGHQRWPEAADMIRDIWGWLPESYRYNRQLNRQEHEFLDWDCSKEGFEGIRAQDVLPQLLKRFQPAVFLAWGNIIDVFIDRGFGHAFHAMTEWDMHFIDRVHEMDQHAIESGKITPTHLLARFERDDSDGVVCFPGIPVSRALRSRRSSLTGFLNRLGKA